MRGRAKRENWIVIVILLRVLTRMSFIIERSSGEGFTPFNGNNRPNFCGEKKYNEMSTLIKCQFVQLIGDNNKLNRFVVQR